MENNNNIGFGFNYNKFKIWFVVFAIAVPVVVIITLTHQNSMFELFERFSVSNGKVHGTTRVPNNNNGNNVTSQNLGGRDPNVTTLMFQNDTSDGNFNKTFSQDKLSITGTDHITEPDVGSKDASATKITSDSITNPTNDSTPITKNNTENQNQNQNENLLDGLLASGFDEASCISRFQSHAYHKPSPHKPSSYLISKLRNYEETHRKCGPYSTHYNTSMRNLIRSKKHHSTTMNTTCKYLVWTPANGLGNRMISMAATFLYAVLTDRVLLVKFEHEMMGLFCEPFLNSSWLLPMDSPLLNVPGNVETYQSMMKNQHDSPLVLHLNLQHTTGDPEKLFHCDHSHNLVQKVPFFILQTDQYFVPSLFMVPSFSHDLTHMFPEKDTVFHHLGRYLFHPSNQAWGLITRFYQAYLARSSRKIGLQIRLFSPNSTPHEAVLDLLLNCTLQHKLLPELDTKNSLDSSSILTRNTSLKAVLVTSLFSEYGERLKTMYLTRPTLTGEVVGVYQPSHEENQKFHNNMHNMKAWTEMYLLSLCDEVMTTSLSTFGYVAQGLGGVKPWLLYRLAGKETSHEPSCERDFSMEPCYHIPPKHDCEGKANSHFISSSFPYMRPCVDYCFGVKLAN